MDFFVAAHIDKSINWPFTYGLVQDKYSDSMGRPSIDPTALIRVPFIQYILSYTNISYLEELAFNGLKNRYPNNYEDVSDRLKYEISIIKKMGFVDYFLIVADFIRFAKDNSIPVGPGRGSAAGSLVAYALEITDIDPIKYNLIFERFLNPERVSMPDINIDF